MDYFKFISLIMGICFTIVWFFIGLIEFIINMIVNNSQHFVMLFIGLLITTWGIYGTYLFFKFIFLELKN